MADEDFPESEGIDEDAPADGGAVESEEIAHAINVFADPDESQKGQDGGDSGASGTVPPMGTAQAVRDTNWFSNYFWNVNNPKDADEWFGFSDRSSDAELLGGYEWGFAVYSGVHLNDEIKDDGDTVWGRFIDRMGDILVRASDSTGGSESYNNSVLMRIENDLEEFHAFSLTNFVYLHQLSESLKPGNDQYEGAGAEALSKHLRGLALEFRNLADYVEPAVSAVASARASVHPVYLLSVLNALNSWRSDPDHAPRRLIRTWWEEQRENVTYDDGIIKIGGRRTDDESTWKHFEDEIKERWWNSLADVREAVLDGISDVSSSYNGSASDILPFAPVPTAGDGGGSGGGSGDGGGDGPGGRSIDDVLEDYFGGGDDDGDGSGSRSIDDYLDEYFGAGDGAGGGDGGGGGGGDGRSVEDIVEEYLNGQGVDSGGSDLPSGGDGGGGTGDLPGDNGSLTPGGGDVSSGGGDPSSPGGGDLSSGGGDLAGGGGDFSGGSIPEGSDPASGGHGADGGGSNALGGAPYSSGEGGGSAMVPPPVGSGGAAMGPGGSGGSGSGNAGRRGQNGAPLPDGSRDESGAVSSAPDERIAGGSGELSSSPAGAGGTGELIEPPSAVPTGSDGLGGTSADGAGNASSPGELDLSSSGAERPDAEVSDGAGGGAEPPFPGGSAGPGELDLSSSGSERVEGLQPPGGVSGSGGTGGENPLPGGSGTPGEIESSAGSASGDRAPVDGGSSPVLTPPAPLSGNEEAGGGMTPRSDSGSVGGSSAPGGSDGNRGAGPGGSTGVGAFPGGGAGSGPGTPAEQQTGQGQAAPGAPGSPMMPPMMPPGGGAGGGGGGGQERTRTTWLAEDEKVWGTASRGGPASLGRPGRNKGENGNGHVPAGSDGGVAPTAPFDTAAPGGGKRKPGVGYRRSGVEGPDGQREGERQRRDR